MHLDGFSSCLGLILWRRRRFRRRIFRLAPQHGPVPAQYERDGPQDDSNEPEERRRPARVQRLKHLRSKQREGGAEYAPHDGAGRKRTGGDEEVRVDGVVEEAEEDPGDADPHGYG